MDFQRELDADLIKNIQNGVPPIGKIFVASFNHFRRHGGEHGQGMPDFRAGEAVDDFNPKLGRDPGSIFYLLGGPLAHPLGIAIPPDTSREDPFVPLVNRVVTDCLADQVRTNGPTLQIILF